MKLTQQVQMPLLPLLSEENDSKMKTNLGLDSDTNFNKSLFWKIAKFLCYNPSNVSLVRKKASIVGKRKNGGLTSCLPLILLSFLILMPSVYSNIEIDPNQIWIKYSQKILGEANILESNDNANIFLTKQESFEDLAPKEHKIEESSDLTYVTNKPSTNTIEETTQKIKSLLLGSQIVTIIGMICALLTVIIICFTVFKIKVRSK